LKCGSGTWTFKKRGTESLEAAQRTSVRALLGITALDHNRNKNIMKKFIFQILSVTINTHTHTHKARTGIQTVGMKRCWISEEKNTYRLDL